MGSPKTKDEMITPEEHHDENEAATVVIDINQFRKELDSVKEQASDEVKVDIEFNVHSSKSTSTENELPTPPPISSEDSALSLDSLEDDNEDIDLSLSVKPKTRAILFDFKSSKLSELHQGHESETYDFHIINELSELNHEIKSHTELVLVFYYNQAPKAINTLMKQLNSKFSHIQTMIIADNLSDKKALAHQKTASGAKVYISTPETFEDVEKKLTEI